MKLVLRVDQRLDRLVRQLWVFVVALIVLGPLVAGVTFALDRVMTTTYTPAYEHNVDLRLAMLRAQADLRIQERTRTADFAGRMELHHDEAYRQLDEVTGLLSTRDRFSGDLDRTRAAMDQWWRKADAVRADIEQGRPADLTAPIADFTAFDDAVQQVGNRVRDNQDYVRAARDSTVLAGLLVTVLAGAYAFLVARREVRSTTTAIVEPIQQLDRVVEARRSGGGDLRADTGIGPPEIRNLAGALNGLLDEEDRRRAEDEHVRRIQTMALHGAQVLREATALPDAATRLAEIIGAGLDARGCVVRFRAVTQDRVSRFWVDDAGPLTGADAARMDALVPPSRLDEPHTLDLGDHSALVVSVRLGSEHHGMISVLRGHGDADWSAAEIAMVEQIADTLARGLFELAAQHVQRRNLAELRELDRQKTAFVSTVSHELRTPLAAIAGNAEMLADGDAGPLNASQLKMVDAVERNTGRLRHLVEDLLVLNRIESADRKVERSRVDLAELAREVVAELLADRRADRTADVQVESAGEPVVEGHREHLRRAVAGLVGNALKFTRPDGHVVVSVTRKGARVTVAVVDDGMGVPTEQHHLVGDRFFRASNAQAAEVPGTGLGLSIARAIAEGHRGSLTFDSVEGGGSTFRIALPAAGPVAAPVERDLSATG